MAFSRAWENVGELPVAEQSVKPPSAGKRALALAIGETATFDTPNECACARNALLRHYIRYTSQKTRDGWKITRLT